MQLYKSHEPDRQLNTSKSTNNPDGLRYVDGGKSITRHEIYSTDQKLRERQKTEKTLTHTINSQKIRQQSFDNVKGI